LSDVDLKAMFPHRFRQPKLHPTALVTPGAHVYGDVEVGEESSIWFNTVLRGDVNYIRVGKRTNIQDCSLVHVAYKAYPCLIGDDVTIGHSAVVHACTIGNFTLIGMGSQILDGAEIGDYVLLGAGSLVTPKMKIPSGMKAFGRPAKIVAELTDEERAGLRKSAEHYVHLAKTYR
jgi:carbonic anhydrase/acetyltransferase-like protein (isoleucine patch superfamily)